ncbi:hypothetical protein [Nostoc edaphicum]|nr:hypothetical protein [Nostoc edaphicum]
MSNSFSAQSTEFFFATSHHSPNLPAVNLQYWRVAEVEKVSGRSH